MNDPAIIDEMLRKAQAIAVVGMSDKPWRASHNIGRYLPGDQVSFYWNRPDYIKRYANGTVVVTHVQPIHHRLHRVVWFDRHGHRHVAWR